MNAPKPVPHMVTRHIPAGHNFMGLGEYVPARTYEEQNGWKVEADGLKSWSMTPEGATRMWTRMAEARAMRQEES